MRLSMRRDSIISLKYRAENCVEPFYVGGMCPAVQEAPQLQVSSFISITPEMGVHEVLKVKTKIKKLNK